MSHKRVVHVIKFVVPMAVGVAAAALISPIPAGANPGGVGDAAQVIAEIQARGDQVIVSKTGDKELSKCTVTAVRLGPPIYQAAPRFQLGVNSPVRNVSRRLTFVDVKC